MSKHRFATALRKPPTASTQPAGGPRGAWGRFWFTPVDPIGLHHLRVLAGLLFLAWLLPLAGEHQALFGLDGWLDQQAYVEAAHLPGGPPHPLGWSILYACGSNPWLVSGVYWLSIAVLALFTLGLWPRLLAVFTWVVVSSFATPPATRASGEQLLSLFALYLMLGYVFTGQRIRGQSFVSRFLGTRASCQPDQVQGVGSAAASLGANLALRLLQVHFAMLVLLGGLQKLQVGDWWSGSALWYGWQSPFEISLIKVQKLAPHATWYLGVLSVLAYGTLAWQIGFPAFAWRPRWRLVLLGGAVIGWIGSALLGQSPILGPAILVGCFGYLTPHEWHRLDHVRERLGGLRRWPRAYIGPDRDQRQTPTALTGRSVP